MKNVLLFIGCIVAIIGGLFTAFEVIPGWISVDISSNYFIMVVGGLLIMFDWPMTVISVLKEKLGSLAFDLNLKTKTDKEYQNSLLAATKENMKIKSDIRSIGADYQISLDERNKLMESNTELSGHMAKLVEDNKTLRRQVTSYKANFAKYDKAKKVVESEEKKPAKRNRKKK